MQVVLSWGICAAVIMTWFTVTYFMVKPVEKRIRVTGDLARY